MDFMVFPSSKAQNLYQTNKALEFFKNLQGKLKKQNKK
jgi:hypothetical protein